MASLDLTLGLTHRLAGRKVGFAAVARGRLLSIALLVGLGSALVTPPLAARAAQPVEAADMRSTLGASVVTGQDAARFRQIADRLGGDLAGQLDAKARASGLEKIVIGAQPIPTEGDPKRLLVITMTIGSRAPGASLARLDGLSPDQRALLQRVATGDRAKQLLGWEDRTRPESERGAKIPRLSAVALDASRATELKALVAEMRRRHLGGLAARARSIGYYREAMAVAKVDGQPTFLLYLETTNEDWRTKLRAYPDTDFTRWWNAPFNRILGPRSLANNATIVLDWEASRAGR